MSKYPKQLVFGLDIGTRSIVGTVGYKNKDRFFVIAQKAKEHKTRAMLDGQIHDIAAVADTVRDVKLALEEELEVSLKDVSIAAAGRVLKTVAVRSDEELENEREVVEEDVYALSTKGVELAYDAFQKENADEKMQFYCVGYSVVRYYLNDYPMGNLVGHKAKKISAELIATFLPDDVVDGLYKAVETADLQVVNMTLEPIAAIGVAIPEMYRMLNIALVDVGAGTSDISITKDGCIVAFGMIPMAGDALTEVIARHCLVDFATAEQIKRGVEKADRVTYQDIMGLDQTISKEDVLSVAEPVLDEMAQLVSDKIKELNGDKSVSAVFVVGGGGRLEGYTQKLAKNLGIAPERVAVRGEQVMKQIEFVNSDLAIDSLLVTPIGICLSFYEQSNNFIYVTFNEKRVKLYENGNLAVIDAALQAQFENEDLFPKRGTPLQYTVNGVARLTRGEQGESAQIFVNGKEADIHSRIKENDTIRVIRSTKGADAQITVSELPESGAVMEFIVQGQKISVPKYVMVNGELESPYYEIKQGDKIEFLNYYTVEQLLQFMDVEVGYDAQIYVNHYGGDFDTPVYEGFAVDWNYEEALFERQPEPKKKERVRPSFASTEDGEDGINKSFDDGTDAAEVMDGAGQVPGDESEAKIGDGAAAGVNAGDGTAVGVNVGDGTAAGVNAGDGATAGVNAGNDSSASADAGNDSSASADAGNDSPVGGNAGNDSPVGGNAGNGSPAGVDAGNGSSADVNAGGGSSAGAGNTAAENIVNNAVASKGKVAVPLHVQVNKSPIVMSGKASYVYVDVFDYIDFDLGKANGRAVVTTLNGRAAQYMEALHEGDVIEVYWKEQ